MAPKLDRTNAAVVD